jgi:hypothetical protein
VAAVIREHGPDKVDGDGTLDGVNAAIVRALRGLRFGSVEITVHDGRVTQIERKEKMRLHAGSRPDPIGRPKDRAGSTENHQGGDPTGRPEALPREHAGDEKRTMVGNPEPVTDDDRNRAVGRRGAGGGASAGT